MQLLVEASRTLGLPDLPDYNVEAPLGLTRSQLNWQDGRRKSAAATYLVGARAQSNLIVMTGVTVRAISTENGAATAVVIRRDGVESKIAANAEVILSAGAIGSPLLLEASGIGQVERLSALGIPVVASAPEVGENLRDHLYIMTQYKVRGLDSLNTEMRGWRVAKNALHYAFNRRGAFSGTPIEITGYANAGGGEGSPDIQMFASPITYTFETVKGKIKAVVARDPGMTISFYQAHPRSTGHVHMKGGQDVALNCGFLTNETDQRAVVAGIRYCRALARAAPLSKHIVEELGPRSDIPDDDDNALLAFAKSMGGSGFHAVGTCRMGADAASVVDLALRARAVRRLRIVDASVMPDIIGANTHAPTVMIAERAASLILGQNRQG
jgi:choline dehydrogenase